MGFKENKSDFIIEFTAGTSNLIGLYLGSTNLSGALVYSFGLMFWWWIMVRRRMWGMLHLNFISTIILGYNVWHALNLKP